MSKYLTGVSSEAQRQ